MWLGLGEQRLFRRALQNPVGAGTGSYGHGAIAEVTSISGSNNITTGTERSTAKLKSVQSGVTLELQATEVSVGGALQNNAGGWVEGAGIITYTKVTVTAPAGKGCKVAGEAFSTGGFYLTTEGLTNQLKFTPSVGNTFAEFTVEGCSITALNHPYTVNGSVIANWEGATVSTTHVGVTAANSLTVAGQKAGIEGSVTLRGANGNGLTLT